MILLELSNG